MPNQLPAVITDCLEYQELTEEERLAFVQRVQSTIDLGAGLSEGTRRNDFSNFFQFVEDLEQDASHLQEFALPWGGTLSRWLVHYSWTFDTSPAQMRASLAPHVVELINASDPSTDAGIESTDKWLVELGAGLLFAGNSFMKATTFSTAMAHLIAADILLGRVLSACYKLRLNRFVPR